MIAFANETTLVVLPKPIEINKSDMKRLRKRLINIKKLPGAENAPVVCLQGDGAYNNPLYAGAGRTPFQHATQVVYTVVAKNKLCSQLIQTEDNLKCTEN